MGTLGVFLTYFLCVAHLGLSWKTALLAVLASEVGGFVTLMVVLNLQNIKVIKKWIIPTVSRTWIVFTSIYILVTYAFLPAEIGFRSFLPLIMPLIFSTGFVVILFGPIQDAIVRRGQRKMRAGVKAN